MTPPIPDEECAEALRLATENPSLTNTDLGLLMWPEANRNSARQRFRLRVEEARNRGMVIVSDAAFPPPPHKMLQWPAPPPAEPVPDWVARLGAPTSPEYLEIPGSPSARADNFLELSGDWGILSDLHIPYHSARVITRFTEDLRTAGIPNAVIAGDWLDGGQFHPKRGVGQQHKRRFQEDADLAKEVFRAILSRIPGRLVLLMGNHDRWFATHMRGQVDPEWLLSNIFHEFAERITFSEFEQCRITSASGVRVRVLHGAQYSSVNPLGVGKRLATKLEEGVVMGHQHVHETGRSVSGLHQIVCMGGAYDPSLLGYIHESPRSNPAMTQGYAFFKDGFLHAIDATEYRRNQ